MESSHRLSDILKRRLPVVFRPQSPRVEYEQGRTVRIESETLRRKPIVMPTESSPAASGYRMLRAQVLRVTRAESLRCIGFVSAADGEGKTLTAVNLALSLAAEPNQTVVLLDLDLRRPGVATLLDLTVQHGLESWFADRASEDDVAYSVEGVERLTLMPTLAPIANSSEALASSRTRELLRDMRLREPDRLMLLDLPPVLLADDFLTIAPLLDGVVLVAREGVTKRDDLARVRELLAGTRLLGTVLNDSIESETRAY